VSARLPIHQAQDTLELASYKFTITGVTPSISGPWEVLEAHDDGKTFLIKAVSLKGMAGDWSALDCVHAESRVLKVRGLRLCEYLCVMCGHEISWKKAPEYACTKAIR
jgi:hypothetical protein